MGITRPANAAATVSYAFTVEEYPNIQFSLDKDAYSIGETEGPLEITVKRSGRLDESTAVTFMAVVDADGENPAKDVDFGAVTKLVPFAAHETNKCVSVTVNNCDGFTSDKTFRVKLALSETAPYTELVAPSDAVVTIQDEDKLNDEHDEAVNGGDSIGNESWETATELPGFSGSSPEASKINNLASGEDSWFAHYMSSTDTTDWFKMKLDVPANETVSYQICVTNAVFRGSLNGDPDPTRLVVQFMPDSAADGAEPEAVTPKEGSLGSLSEILNRRLSFTASESGTVYLGVSAGEIGNRNVAYDIAYCLWAEPVLSFKPEAGKDHLEHTLETAAGNDSRTVTVVRSANTQGSLDFTVSTLDGNAMGGVHYVALDAKAFTFADGESEKEIPIEIIAKDDGLWHPDLTFTLKAEYAVEKSAEVEMKLITVLPEGDGRDGGDVADGGQDGSAGGAEALEKFDSATRGSLSGTLNGKDCEDWFVLTNCLAGVKYRVRLSDVSGTTDLLAVDGELYYGKPEGEVQPFCTFGALDDYIAKTENDDSKVPYFEGTGEDVYLRVFRSANEKACVTYTVDYGKWIEASVEFVDRVVYVYNTESVVSVGIRCSVAEALGAGDSVKVKFETTDDSAHAGEHFTTGADDTVFWAPVDFVTPDTTAVKTVDFGIEAQFGSLEQTDKRFYVQLKHDDDPSVGVSANQLEVVILGTNQPRHGTLAITGFAKDFTVVEGTDLAVSVQRSDSSVYPGSNAEAVITLTGTGAARFTEQSQTLRWSSLEGDSVKTATFAIPATDDIEGDVKVSLTLTSPTTTLNAKAVKFTGTIVDQAFTQSLADYVKAGDSPLAWKTSGSRWFWNDGAGLSTDTLAANAKPAVLTASLATPGVLTFTAKGGNGTLTAKTGTVTQAFKLDGDDVPVVLFSKTAKTAVTLSFKPDAARAQVALADVAWYPLTAPAIVAPLSKSAFAVPDSGRDLTLSWTGPDLTNLPQGVDAAYWFNGSVVSNFGSAFQGRVALPANVSAFTGKLELRVSYGGNAFTLEDKAVSWALLPEGAVPAFEGSPDSVLTEDGLASGATVDVALRKAVYAEFGPFAIQNRGESALAKVVSGKLPVGMALSVEPTGLVLKGSPSVVGPGVCLIQVESKSGGAKSYTKGETILIRYEVKDLPPWSVGTFYGQLQPGSSPFPGALSGGMVTLTVASKTGTITGKYTVGGKGYAFKASGFSGENEDGVLDFETFVMIGKEKAPLFATLSGDLQGVVAFTDSEDNPVAAAWQQQWSLPGQDITPYVGYYTFSLADQSAEATGFGYMTATIDKKGAVKLAGKTTDGQAFSASAGLFNLLEGEAYQAQFVFGASPSAYKGGDLTGRVTLSADRVAVNGKSDFSFFTKNPAALLPANTNFTGRIIGGWFTKNEDLAARYADGLVFNLAAMPDLTAAQTGLDGKATTVRLPAVNPSPAGLPIAITLDRRGVGTGIEAPAAGKPVKNSDGSYAYSAENTAALTAKVTRTTGLLSGSVTGWYDYPANLGAPARLTHVSKKLTYSGIWIQNADISDDEGFFGALPVPCTRVGSDNKAYTFNEQIQVKILLRPPR